MMSVKLLYLYSITRLYNYNDSETILVLQLFRYITLLNKIQMQTAIDVFILYKLISSRLSLEEVDL